MAVRLPKYKSNNTTFPVYEESAATKAFAALSGRLALIEGDAAFIQDGFWHDRETNAKYAIGGVLSGGQDVVNGRGAAAFAGTQWANLGAIFPIGGDYSIFVAYRQAAGGSSQGILAGADPSYHSFHLLPANGRLNASHAGASFYAGATSHALGTLYTAGVTFIDSSKAYDIYFNGVSESAGVAAASNTDGTATVGDIPGLAGDRKFRGSLYHLSLWNRALAGDDLDTLNAYLAEQYL